jgi:Radical SAM superfamily
MGRQPFGLASPAAWLRAAGVEVTCVDLSKEKLHVASVCEAGAIAFFLPMHTATRLAVPVIDRVRALNPAARLIAYGLYAPLNGPLLREHGVADVLGGEFEEDLVRSVAGRLKASATELARLNFIVPERDGLLPLSRYATLQMAGERRTAGYTEASRGCKHRCRHCPIVPVYDGRFRIVPPDIVLADVRAQVAAGARHVTFGDPDFFNGIRHADAVVRGVAREFPGITYDVTIKIEHLLRHQQMLPVLRDTGCAFVTSAVESIDDRLLEKLEKGHTRADFERVVALCREAGLTLAPTFVPFTPWTTLESYVELLREIARLDLVDHVAAIQLAIRLLVPEGSRMLELEEVRAVTGSFNAASLTYPWRHPDPRVDVLHDSLTRIVGVKLTASRRELFARVWDLAHERAGLIATRRDVSLTPRAAVPYLNEPWYC